MILIHIKIAIRNLLTNRFYAIINLIGLSIGIAAFLILTAYTRHEWSFDQFHERSDRIYRLGLTARYEGIEEKWANVPNIAGPHFQGQIASVVNQTRILKHNFGRTAFIAHDDRHFTERNLYWADGTMLGIFDFDMIKVSGVPLDEPNELIISYSSARKLFGTLEEALGSVIEVDNRHKLMITGIYRDMPSNSSIDFPMVGSLSTLDWAVKNLYWSNASFETYLLVAPETNVDDLTTQIDQSFNQAVPQENQWFSFWVQPLHKLHLHSSGISNSYTSNLGNADEVSLLFILAVLVLLMACFNYVHLATALAQNRSKEVGIAKTLGAGSIQLGTRFLIETGVLVLMSIIAGLGISYLLSPLFEQLFDRTFFDGLFVKISTYVFLLGVWLLVTLAAGAYPAFFLSRFTPKNAFNPSGTKVQDKIFARKLMVASQFAICLALISAVLIFGKQIRYIINKDLGYDAEQVLVVHTAAAGDKSEVQGFLDELKTIPAITGACRATTYPGSTAPGYAMQVPSQPEVSISVASNHVTTGFDRVLGLEFLAGRSLPVKSSKDTTVQVVFNETAVRLMGWTPQEAIGQIPKGLYQYPTTIVGVVKDFHHESLHIPIGAYAFNNGNQLGRLAYVMIKMQSEDFTSTIDQIGKIFHENIHSSAFEYKFLDEEVGNLYASDRRLMTLVFIFTIIAIVISCLGLLGLTAYRTEQRMKEIGIRKVLGAGIWSIVWLLISDLVKIMILALVVSLPLAWLFMQNWLNGFAYRTLAGWETMGLAAAIGLTIALLTTAFLAFRGATTHPVKVLKNTD